MDYLLFGYREFLSYIPSNGLPFWTNKALTGEIVLIESDRTRKVRPALIVPRYDVDPSAIILLDNVFTFSSAGKDIVIYANGRAIDILFSPCGENIYSTE